jgi:hypothetical protein
VPSAALHSLRHTCMSRRQPMRIRGYHGVRPGPRPAELITKAQEL